MHSRIFYKQWKCYGHFIEIRFKKNILNYIGPRLINSITYAKCSHYLLFNEIVLLHVCSLVFPYDKRGI